MTVYANGYVRKWRVRKWLCTQMSRTQLSCTQMSCAQMVCSRKKQPLREYLGETRQEVFQRYLKNIMLKVIAFFPLKFFLNIQFTIIILVSLKPGLN